MNRLLVASTLTTLLSLATPGAPPGSEFTDTLGTLSRTASPEDIARVTERLAQTPGAPGALLDIACRGALPSGGGGAYRPLNASQARALELAAPLLDRGACLAAVREGLSRGVDARWRFAALELLALHADGKELPLLADLILEPGGKTSRDRTLVRAFHAAVESVLLRDRKAYEALGWLPNQAPEVRDEFMRAVGAAGDARGLDWLAELLHEPDLAARALQEISRLAPSASPEQAAELAPRLRDLCAQADPGPRKHAMRALARLGDLESIPGLIAVLEVGSAGEAKVAHAALETLTGHSFAARASSWSAWYLEERRWVRERARGALEELNAEDDAVVVTAVREISGHTLYRAELSVELCALLELHPSPQVRAQTAAGLGRLGQREACPGLCDALEDPDEMVRQRAREALTSILGQDAGSDPEDWAQALSAPR